MADQVVDDLARARLGRTLRGKWRLEGLVGVGGMAAVYAATHRNGARVAIKILHPTVSASDELRARFVREGYLANKVNHPNVIRVLDDDVDDDGAAFLVMDLVLGCTLTDKSVEDDFNAAELLDVGEQVLQVLCAAHAHGVIHRDLKPDNLLVDETGKVFVLDFGIARLLDADGLSATRTGHSFGTPGFVAPEQARGRKELISARTDLYALGATLFALATGQFVHEADTPQELLIRAATEPARSLGAPAPHLPREIVELVDRALKMSPDDRWPSASAMLDEVRRVKTALGLTASHVLRLPSSPLLMMAEPLSEPLNDPQSETVPAPDPETESSAANRVAMPSRSDRAEHSGPALALHLPTRPSLGAVHRLRRRRSRLGVACAVVAVAAAFALLWARKPTARPIVAEAATIERATIELPPVTPTTIDPILVRSAAPAGSTSAANALASASKLNSSAPRGTSKTSKDQESKVKAILRSISPKSTSTKKVDVGY